MTPSPRTSRTLAVAESVADELGVRTAQVALNWVATQPGIAAAIVGASSAAQLETSIGALAVELPASLRTRLDSASAPAFGKPYRMFTPEYQQRIVSVGTRVSDKPHGYRNPVRNWA